MVSPYITTFKTNSQPKLQVALANSSVNFHILSYLTLTQVTILQLLNKRFYNRFIGQAISLIRTESHKFGTMPINRGNRKQFYVRGGSRKLTILKLVKKITNEGKQVTPQEPSYTRLDGQEWSDFEAKWGYKSLEAARYNHQTNSMEKQGIYQFGFLQAGATIVMNPIEKRMAYVIGGLDQERRVSTMTVQVMIDPVQEYDEYVRILDPMPEGRFNHSAIFIRGMILVTGGLRSLCVDMQMHSQVPCQQTCWALPVNSMDKAVWRTDIPNMQQAGSLQSTLISIDNRYVFQISGSNPHCQNACRLDMDRLDLGWTLYAIQEKLTKIPRCFLTLREGIEFDLEYPGHDGSPIEDGTARDDENSQWWQRSTALEAINKIQMAVIHLPQKRSENCNIDSNQISFLCVGGMAFSKQQTENKAYLVTLRHDVKTASISKVTNADLPAEGETFRDNASLYIDGYKRAMVGREKIYGIDTSVPATQLKWKVLADTGGETEQYIPHPDQQNMSRSFK